MAGGGGGAWKVAYADFVTAMMALFMVLWISAQDKEILIATSQYFQNPFRSPMDASSGVMPFNSNKSTNGSGTQAGESADQARQRQIQMTYLNSVAADFYRLINLEPSEEKKPIDIQVTSDGLRVTLFDRAKRPLFDAQSTQFTPWGTFVLQNMAWTIDRHGFNVSIVGHAGAASFPDRPGYSHWELSADRANAARRTLVHYAVEGRQIESVTGLADTRPIPGDTDPESHERITLNLTLTAKSRLQAAQTAAPPPAKPADSPLPAARSEASAP